MQVIRHAKATKPILIPYNGDLDAGDVNRVQNLSGGTTQPFTMLYEHGREDKMAVDKDILNTTAKMTQLEYGEMDTYLLLANLASTPVNGLTLDDFSDAKVDMYITGKDDYNGVLEQTMWLPKLTVNSLTINIADANARIERSFDFSGDKFRMEREGNKYLIYKKNVVDSGYSEDPYAIVLNDPAPVVNPNHAGQYLARVWRIRSGVTTELNVTTDYTWTNGTTTLSILSATTGDIIKVIYTAASYGTAGDPTSLNDVDDYYLKASYITVSLQSGAGSEIELDKLTSLNIAATLNRIDEGVLGNDEKILKEVQSKTTVVRLDGRVKDSTLEEVLMGQAGNNWGEIDADLFASDITLRVKIYEDATKTSFKIGYKVTDMFFTDTTEDANANEFWKDAVTLQSDNLTISGLEANIDA